MELPKPSLNSICIEKDEDFIFQDDKEEEEDDSLMDNENLYLDSSLRCETSVSKVESFYKILDKDTNEYVMRHRKSLAHVHDEITSNKILKFKKKERKEEEKIPLSSTIMIPSLIDDKKKSYMKVETQPLLHELEKEPQSLQEDVFVQERKTSYKIILKDLIENSKKKTSKGIEIQTQTIEFEDENKEKKDSSIQTEHEIQIEDTKDNTKENEKEKQIIDLDDCEVVNIKDVNLEWKLFTKLHTIILSNNNIQVIFTFTSFFSLFYFSSLKTFFL